MDATLLRGSTRHPSVAVRVFWPAATALSGAAMAAALAIRDPHVPGSWGSCVFLQVTGLYCPGCGGLRAAHDLVHLDVAAAVSSNAFAVLLALLVAVVWTAWTRGQITGRGVTWDRWVTAGNAYLLLGSVGVFAILRNTPLLASFAP